MLTCDFNLCIYQQNGKCTLSEIDINGMGFCDNAVIVELPEAELLAYKTELSDKMDFYEKAQNVIK